VPHFYPMPDAPSYIKRPFKNFNGSGCTIDATHGSSTQPSGKYIASSSKLANSHPARSTVDASPTLFNSDPVQECATSTPQSRQQRNPVDERPELFHSDPVQEHATSTPQSQQQRDPVAINPRFASVQSHQQRSTDARLFHSTANHQGNSSSTSAHVSIEESDFRALSQPNLSVLPASVSGKLDLLIRVVSNLESTQQQLHAVLTGTADGCQGIEFVIHGC
jgi:hypothetical protein